MFYSDLTESAISISISNDTLLFSTSVSLDNAYIIYIYIYIYIYKKYY